MPIIPEHIWQGIAPSAWRGSEPARHPIGSGQYRFVRWIPRAVVELAADTANYRGSPKLSRVIWSIAPDFNTAVTRFLSGETDFFEALRPENLAEVAKHPELRTKQYRGLAYIFAQFNLRDPSQSFAAPSDFRQSRAPTRADDGDRPRRRWSGASTILWPSGARTDGARVPDHRSQSGQIPFDLARARQILDSLGWRDANGDGIRERNGRPLAVLAHGAGHEQARVRLAVLLQEQLRQAGVKVDVEQLDFPVLIERERKRAFDAAIGQWNTQPSPGSVRGLWGTAGSRLPAATITAPTRIRFSTPTSTARWPRSIRPHGRRISPERTRRSSRTRRRSGWPSRYRRSAIIRGFSWRR